MILLRPVLPPMRQVGRREMAGCQPGTEQPAPRLEPPYGQQQVASSPAAVTVVEVPAELA